jgi:hypothetical protein
VALAELAVQQAQAALVAQEALPLLLCPVLLVAQVAFLGYRVRAD